jgi:uncharacterized protein YndB with AHSA1/START domain
MSKSGASTATASVDWLPRIDFMLEHPVESVWPLLVHWEKWIDPYRCEHVSGPVDAVGEMKRVSQVDAAGKVLEYFHIEIVRLVPKERLAYRILSHGDYQLGPISHIHGYEIFNVHPLKERTLVTYETVAGLESNQITQAEFDKATEGDLTTGLRRWQEEYIPKLRGLLSKKA